MDQAVAIAQTNGYTKEEIDFSETIEAWIILKNLDEIIPTRSSSHEHRPQPEVTATITTNRGEMVITLYPSEAPMTVRLLGTGRVLRRC